MSKNLLDLEQAKAILEKEQATCAFVKGEEVSFSTERGVTPLLKLLQADKSLAGYSAADKVVGKAAAFLYVILKVERVYAKVISQYALSVLRNYHIEVEYDELVDAIRNRTNTGFCPMETAVLSINVPEEALAAIQKKQEELRRG